MRSLTLKLTIIILIASLVGVTLVAFLAQRSTARRLNELITAQERNGFMEQVTTYYSTQNSWMGFRESLPRLLDQTSNGQNPLPRPRPNGPGRQPRPGPLPFVLLDANGCVLLPGGRYVPDECLSEREIASGTPVLVNDQNVGTVLTINNTPVLNGIEQTYLNATRQSLWLGALGGAAVALLLGLLLARMVTRPLKELTQAIHNMQGGELKQEVRVRSMDELGELAVAFNQMSADLDRANQLRRQMTADIAHELRNPLVVLIGYLESMRDGVLKPTEQRLETMYTEAQHLQTLVMDLRTLSLADAGELTLNRTTTGVTELLDRIMTAYEPQATAQDITLKMELLSSQLSLTVDEDRITQVLGNLVSNALRYTPTDGTITLGARASNGAVLITVQDTGIGIRQEEQARIFERFFRVDQARADEGGESGLGLAIAKSIVELHGGEIRVESAPGQGAKFILAFPDHLAVNV